MISAYYSFIDPERMKGWVDLVGWPAVDGLPTWVVTRQLQVGRRTGKVRQPNTDVLPLSQRHQHIELSIASCSIHLCNTEYWCVVRQTVGSCAWAHEFTLIRLSSLCHRTAPSYSAWKFSGIQIQFDIQTTAASSLIYSGNTAPSHVYYRLMWSGTL